MNVQSIIDITDAMMIAMCVPNVIVLYILAPEIKRNLKDYLERHNMNFIKSAKLSVFFIVSDFHYINFNFFCVMYTD